VISTILTLVVIPVVYMLVPSRVRTQADDDALEAAVRDAQIRVQATEGSWEGSA
jgi:hypothetical protein